MKISQQKKDSSIQKYHTEKKIHEIENINIEKRFNDRELS